MRETGSIHTVRTLSALALGSLAAGGAVAQDEPSDRMGAYQCISCARGGFLEGVRGGFGRVRREFAPGKRLCVAKYDYLDGELYVYFRLDGIAPPTARSWSSQPRPSAPRLSSGGEPLVPLRLDDTLWPADGRWGVKASSWNAQCR